MGPAGKVVVVNESEKRRVVITGIGLVSPVGNTAEETWSALLAGHGGVDYITRFDTSNFPVRFAAETKGFDPTKFVKKKELKKMDYFIYFAIASSREALADSGRATWNPPEVAAGNVDKIYLKSLESAGIAIPKTRARRGSLGYAVTRMVGIACPSSTKRP